MTQGNFFFEIVELSGGNSVNGMIAIKGNHDGNQKSSGWENPWR
jgi:hypothetical protein